MEFRLQTGSGWFWKSQVLHRNPRKLSCPWLLTRVTFTPTGSAAPVGTKYWLCILAHENSPMGTSTSQGWRREIRQELGAECIWEDMRGILNPWNSPEAREPDHPQKPEGKDASWGSSVSQGLHHTSPREHYKTRPISFAENILSQSDKS